MTINQTNEIGDNMFLNIIKLISLGNYNIANIILNAQLYKKDGDDNDNSDSDSDEMEPSNADIAVADVNKRDSEQRTLTHLAVLAGDVKLVKSLLKHGADVNLVDNVGSVSYYYLSENNDFVIINFFVNNLY